jgi:nitroreductase
MLFEKSTGTRYHPGKHVEGDAQMDLATVDKLLTTTRSVRKRLDLTRPVEPEIIQECLDIAIQAPTGGNRQGYHFVVVTDADKRVGLADLYRKAFYETWTPQRKEDVQQRDPRNLASYFYLAEHLHEVPVHIIPCLDGRLVGTEHFAQASGYGGILPTAWSLMLALRARGVGSAWTTVHLKYAQEAAALLGIPDHITQAALLPVAYYTGDDFKPATRVPARERTYWNGWKQTR